MVGAFLRCERCGALADPGPVRCRYCDAALVRIDNLVAATFGEGPATWELTPPVDLVHMEVGGGARHVRFDLPAQSEVAGPVMACAWTRGEFVDVDVSATISFEVIQEGVGAGFWLRSGYYERVRVTLHGNGWISAATEERVDGKMRSFSMGELAPARPFGPGVPTVLRARLVGEVLTIYQNGVPSGSLECIARFNGQVELYVQVAQEGRTRVVFGDPVVLLA